MDGLEQGFLLFALQTALHDDLGLLGPLYEKGFVLVVVGQMRGPAAAGPGGLDAAFGGGDPGCLGGRFHLGQLGWVKVGVAVAGGGGAATGLRGQVMGFELGGSFRSLFRGQSAFNMLDQVQGAGRAVSAGPVGGKGMGAAGAGFQGGKRWVWRTCRAEGWNCGRRAGIADSRLAWVVAGGGLVFGQFSENVPVQVDCQVNYPVYGFRTFLPGPEGAAWRPGLGWSRGGSWWDLASGGSGPVFQPVPGQEGVQALLPLFHFVDGLLVVAALPGFGGGVCAAGSIPCGVLPVGLAAACCSWQKGPLLGVVLAQFFFRMVGPHKRPYCFV